MAGCRSSVAALALLAATAAGADDTLRNWFDDPFFAVSALVADCPPPAGPFVDEAERRVQAHRRAEKGTTCWLAGVCERPNAYAYDRDIAAALQVALRERPPLAASSLWVTVQGRVMYIEGCATTPSEVDALQALARSLPQVEQVIAIVRTDPAAAPPYRVRPAR